MSIINDIFGGGGGIDIGPIPLPFGIPGTFDPGPIRIGGGGRPTRPPRFPGGRPPMEIGITGQGGSADPQAPTGTTFMPLPPPDPFGSRPLAPPSADPQAPAPQGACPPGTRCRAFQFGTNICLGGCAPIEGSGLPRGATGPISQEPIPLPSQQMCACNGRKGGSCPCCLPDGRIGRPNRSRYFRKLDRCAVSSDPNSYELVNPGDVCVSRRTMNPANPKAARAAIRRLTGFHRMMKRTEKSLRKLAR